MKTPSRFPVNASGFSRSDLFVTTIVVSGLVTISFSAVGVNRSAGEAAACLVNLRNVAQSLHAYAADNRDLLPGNVDDGGQQGYNWVGGIMFGADATNRSVLTNAAVSRIAPYVTDAAWFRCPSDTAQFTVSGQVYERARSYSMNGAVGTRFDLVQPVDGPWLDNNHSHRANSTWRTYGRFSDMVSPSPAGLLLLVDEDSASINDGSFGMGMRVEEWIDFPAVRHDFGAAVAFADGSARIKHWLDIRTAMSNGGLARRAVPGSPDVAWLQERTSALVK